MDELLASIDATRVTGRRMTSPRKTAYYYAYGFVRSGFDVRRAPTGLDDASVVVVESGEVGALTSRVPADDYAPDMIERRSGEVAWLSPRALAHDRVLTWAQEHGGVIPLPMFSLWRDESALRTTLAEKLPVIRGLFERVREADEFGLRVYRRDAVMLQALDEIDPEMARLRSEAESASPGQRYLLERKIADQGKSVVRSASQSMARKVFEELRARSRDAISRPLTPTGGAGGGSATPSSDTTLVLNGAFLVDRTRLDEFRAAVGAHVRELQPRGLSFDFTGPWPPYNFVADASDAPRPS